MALTSTRWAIRASDGWRVVVLDRVDQAKIAGEQQPNEKEGLHGGQYIRANRSISFMGAPLGNRIFAAKRHIRCAENRCCRFCSAALAASPAEAQPQTPAAVFTRYCVTCHNATAERRRPGDRSRRARHVAANPELWEKVVRKLRSSAMPPVNAPRPDQGDLRVGRHVPRNRARSCGGRETESRQAAAAPPADPHRVSERRSRSAGARRASERDGLSPLCFRPTTSAAASTTSRTCSSCRRRTMERYLDAARKISRLAVGDPRDAADGQHPPAASGALAGRAGRGAAVRHARRPRDPQLFPGRRRIRRQLEVAGAAASRTRSKSPSTASGCSRSDRRRCRRRAAERGAAAPHRPLRIPDSREGGRAGWSASRSSSGTRRATKRRSDRGCAPEAPSRRWSASPSAVRTSRRAPANTRAGAASSCAGPSRRGPPRLTISRCAKQILSTLMRRAYRRPGTDAEVERSAAVLHRGQDRRRIRSRDSEGARADAGQPAVPVPHRAGSGERRAPGRAYRVSDLELASRLSFFLWSSIPDDELLDAGNRREAEGSLRCSNSRSGGCWPIRAPNRW